MIELVLTYCLIGSTTCVERRDPLQEFVTPMACITLAQQTASTYVRAHPNWRLAKWGCEINKPREKAA